MIHPYAYYPIRAARWHPARIAIIDGDTRVSYRALEARTGALARALVARGIRRGDRVAILQANTHRFMEALIAVARTGAAFVPMLGSLTEADHAHIVADAGAVALIAVAEAQGQRARALKDRVSTLRHLILAEGGDDQTDYEGLLRAHAGEAPVVEGRPEDLAQILYTSGTTGRPKGVAHAHAGTEAAMIAWASMARREAGDVALLYTPMSHFAARLMDSGWVGGGTAVILPAPDPAGSFAAIAAHRVTHLLA
ncbi:MAG: long-chain fatty acid--CoA ligase, partial [Alphaproteobacteria bacterium]|nr:long-chain fatty acid--CoA ligase [Alphaproteobacteria bacterium]